MNYNKETQAFSTFGDKLLRHCDVLNSIQKGKWKPITVQLSPTGKCDFSCKMCSVKNRDRTLELDFKVIKKGLKDFKKLGAKALELSLKGDELIPIKKNGKLKLMTIKEVVNDRNGSSFTLNSENKFDEGIITDFIEHKQTEPLYKITLDDGRNITVTKSHSIFFFENNEIIYKPVSESKEGDIVVTLSQKPEIIEENLNDDLCRLFGYFVAEGSCSWQRDNTPHGIHFSFAENESYVEDVISILNKLGYKSSVYNYGDSKSHVAVFNKKLCEQFLELGFGRYANQKRVPDVILNSTYNNKIEFLKGLFAGDGNFRSTTHKQWKRNSLHLKTSSKRMTQSLGYLLDMMGIWFTINQGKNAKRFIDNRELPETNYYTINISNKEDLLKMKDIVEFIGGKFNYANSKYSCHIRKKKRVVINSDCYGLRIKKIEEVDKEEMVYDISVKDTHRFEGSFRILCHNTGGGNPLLYPQINELINYAFKLGYKIGLISNSINPSKHLTEKSADQITWYRASLSGFYKSTKVPYDFSIIPEGKLGFSYIITDETTDEHLKAIVELVKQRPDVKFVRIAANCLQGDEIKNFKKKWGKIIESLGEKFFIKEISDNYKPYEYFCGVGMVRPYCTEDGYIYPCSSYVLKEQKYDQEYSIGKLDNVIEMYKQANILHETLNQPYMIPKKCYHCFYANNNKLLHTIVKEISDEDFA
jgi:radical SAM protein with 4Fe4S-binding SPASM domain